MEGTFEKCSKVKIKKHNLKGCAFFIKKLNFIESLIFES